MNYNTCANSDSADRLLAKMFQKWIGHFLNKLIYQLIDIVAKPKHTDYAKLRASFPFRRILDFHAKLSYNYNNGSFQETAVECSATFMPRVPPPRTPAHT